MKIGRPTLRYLAAAAALALAILAMAQPNSNSRASMAGAWQVSITLPPGAPFCASAGALATGDGLILAESCYASEGAGYGVWERTGNSRFAVTFTGNSFGPDGTVTGRYKVRATVTLAPNGDSISGPYQTDFFDAAGNPMGMPVTGTVTGVRNQLELLN